MELGALQGKAVGHNYSITEQQNQAVNKTERNKDKKSSENINANELNLVGQSNSNLKELFAKKSAWKLQTDQFDKDLETDENLKGHAQRRDDLYQEAHENQSEVNRLNSLKEDLKKTYSVSDDSAEQKDLELLEKLYKGKEPLSKEEVDRLNNMGPLTEYQKVSLEYTSMADVFQKRADNASEGVYNENRTISAIKLELLKSSPMEEAKKEAEDMLQKVDEEIQKALLEELKKKVNENLDINPQDQIMTDPQNLINQKKVTEEDLKGLAVDEKV
ncbi:MAG TPA: hypothetical protein VN258_17380 [Mobilitalea sp.]|nr:hypothetical protein [Mobilitalea sp.]